MHVRFGHSMNVLTAQCPRLEWEAIPDFLEDWRSEFGRSKILRLLRRAVAGGAPVEFGGNAFWITTRGAWATLRCTASETVPVVRIRCEELIKLIEAWSSFAQTGAPAGWDVPDGAFRTVASGDIGS